MNASFPFQRATLLLCLIGLSACSFIKNADVGKVTGPTGGSVVGSEVPGAPRNAALFGGILGRINGDDVISQLTEDDRYLMGTLALVTLDQEADLKTRTWRNKSTKHHGSFNAETTWKTSDNVQCRRFTNMIYIEETESQASGTACLQRDGTWSLAG